MYITLRDISDELGIQDREEMRIIEEVQAGESTI